MSYQCLKTIETFKIQLQLQFLYPSYFSGLLANAENSRFPEWFSYSMTETEKRVWNEYVDKNPLKWLDENNFNEDKEHVPYVPETTPRRTGSSNNTATASSSTT